jgi:uncharacterized protein YndB with AHSA1/START domain
VPRDWQDAQEAEVPATPQEVWAAIATGPGIESWYMGQTEVEGGVGGAVRTKIGDFVMASRITAWEPPHKLAYIHRDEEEGGFIAFEFHVEGRQRGFTAVRIVSSGFLPGDDWEAEYEAMRRGGQMYFATMVSYLTHFAGRTGRALTAFGPPAAAWSTARVLQTLGLDPGVAVGDAVHCRPAPGLPELRGVVDGLSPEHLGIRTADAILRFIRNFHGGGVMIEHHLFAPAPDAEAAWQRWLLSY